MITFSVWEWRLYLKSLDHFIKENNMDRNNQREFQTGLQLLHNSEQYLKNPKTVNKGMDLLSNGLSLIKKIWQTEKWKDFCDNVCLSHSIRSLVHQDPITYRSFSKPRGYAGDAVLLDYLYQNPSAIDKLRSASAIGKAICNYHISSPSAESVRWRREILSKIIDETAARVPDAEILAVACGHLREASQSSAVHNNQIKRLVAFDQDNESLKTINTDKNGSPIECVPGNIKDLISHKTKIGSFDFIYSAGLYDYLDDKIARTLSKVLFGMLKKDGRLLIANFVPGNKECGYMEAFMGWELLYRTREQFERIHSDLSQHIQKIFFDENKYVIYLEFRKR